MGVMVRRRKKKYKAREERQKCNHWFLAVGISFTQETVKTAGGSVCVCVAACVCVFVNLMCMCCCHLKRKKEADAFKPRGVQCHTHVCVCVCAALASVLLMPQKMAPKQKAVLFIFSLKVMLLLQHPSDPTLCLPFK